MDCSEARKKLKDYAVDKITEKAERLAVEEHVSGCAVCKRELLLWQGVTEKQVAVSKMQARLPAALKDRIKYRMQKNQKPSEMPATIKKIQSFAGGKGSLIVFFILVCAALIFIFRNSGFKSTILGPILVFTGFGILFLLLLFRGPKKQ